MRKYIVLIVLCFFAVFARAQGLQLSSSGMATFNESQLVVSEAGEDISAILESNSSVFISIYSFYFWEMHNVKWRVYVHKTDIDWGEAINLEVKRDGKGRKFLSNGTPNIHDGNSFSRLTNNPTYFFRGKGLILDIPLAFRLSNLSLALGASDFETDVVFTIYDD